MVRRIIAYKNHFAEFYKSQEEKVQRKIEFVLDFVRFEKQVPQKFLSIYKTRMGFMRFV